MKIEIKKGPYTFKIIEMVGSDLGSFNNMFDIHNRAGMSALGNYCEALPKNRYGRLLEDGRIS